MTDHTPARIGNWIQVQSGKRFYPRDPRAEELDITDIAHALSLICRWTGHCPYHYSVAQHSVLMADLAGREGCSPARQLGCLLHDVAEAYINDMSRPMKTDATAAGYRECEAKIQAVISERWLAPGVSFNSSLIKSLDDAMLHVEAIEFFGLLTVDEWFLGTEPARVKIIEGPWKLWEKRFLNAFYNLTVGEPYRLLQRQNFL